MLGPVDDAYFRWVTDIGLTGPDRGKGGKYLFVPPGYPGELPSAGGPTVDSGSADLRQFRRKPKTNTAARLLSRLRRGTATSPPPEGREGRGAALSACGRDHRWRAAEGGLRQHLGRAVQHDQRQRLHFFEELNRRVRPSPPISSIPRAWACSPRSASGRASRSRPTPHEGDPYRRRRGRQRHGSRDPVRRPRPAREVLSRPAWLNAASSAAAICSRRGERLLDARTMFLYYATGITPAMAMRSRGRLGLCGRLPQFAGDRRSTAARPTRSRCPARSRPKEFWGLRGLRQPDPLAARDRPEDSPASTATTGAEGEAGMAPPRSGSARAARRARRTTGFRPWPGKGWNVLLRLYGLLEPWFDKSWKPGDIERVD